jgi:hypothetical protein
MKLTTAPLWSYSRMITSLREGDISNAFIFPDSHMRALDAGGVAHDVQLLPMQVSNVLDRFADAGVDVTLVPPSTVVSVLRTALDSLPVLFVVFVTLSMFGRMGPVFARMPLNNAVGGGSVPYVVEDVTTTFDVRERVAVHEAGHAVVGQAIDEFDNVSRVTIVPRSSGAGGFTSFTPNEVRNVNDLYTRDYLEAKLAVLLAGRAVEALVLGEDTISVGASNDLRRARSLAEQMTIECPLDGSVLRDTSDGVSEHTLRCIDERVETLLDTAYSRATSILNANRGRVLGLVRRLLEEDTVDDWE